MRSGHGLPPSSRPPFETDYEVVNRHAARNDRRIALVLQVVVFLGVVALFWFVFTL
jgi:hypothetical protein